MFKCLECQTVYKNKVDYCECGNNSFEEIPDPVPQKSEEVVSSKPKEVVEVQAPAVKTITVGEMLSYVIFGACCLFSFAYVFFLGPEPAKTVEKPKVKDEKLVKEIPSIDEIWNDTPAYTVSANVSMDTYKSELLDLLMQNFSLPKFDGDGSCEIEFTIDSAGRLKNKKLIRNSANKPLENSAKKMLTAVKRVAQPPLTYEGTPFRLEFYEHNNEYQLRYVE